MYKENFKADAPPDTVAGPLKDALAHYQDKDYEETIAGLDKAFSNEQRSGEQSDEEELAAFYAYYYKAQSYLALGKDAKALPELNTAVKESPNVELRNSAQWYLALAYLKGGDIKNAQKLLNELSKNSRVSKYKAMAEKLNQQIKPQ